MNFARQKRLLLAALAALAPLPLPFNGIIAWSVLLLFWSAVGLFAYRAARDAESWLSGWAMNLLAIAYLPFFFGDLTLFWRGQVLQPLAHLALFTLAVKLFALKKEADKWHALLATFFLFLAAMGSSVHPTVLLYQFAVLGLSILILVRFAGYHEEAKPAGGIRRRTAPVAGFAALAALAVVLGAVPLFALLPRLRQPYISAPGVRGGSGQMTGFSDQVTLDTIGRVRSSTAVAFRFAFDGPIPPLPEYRFRMAAYDRFRGDRWQQAASQTRLLRRAPDGFFRIAEGRPRSWATIWMKQTALARLALPVETVALDLPAEAVIVDASGSISLLVLPGSAINYRTGLEGRPVLRRASATSESHSAAELDLTGVSPEVADLARQVVGEAGPVEGAERLERHLVRGYRYSLDLLPGNEQRPIDRFLFETRQGHCEYFATAMVLMLRAEGIPARLVTGYYGAEFNPLEEYFIVRQSNAHAWVEAYLPDTGWRTFDPTPAAGLPAGRGESWSLFLTQTYDYLLFRWDRYVLTYGFTDQAGFFFSLRSLWTDLLERFRDRGEPAAVALPAPDESPEQTVDDPAPPSGPPVWMRYRWLPLLLLAAGVAVWVLRRRASAGAIEVYRALRHDLERRRVGVGLSTPPLEVRRRLVGRCPEAEAPGGRIIDLYLEESFAGRAPDERQRREVREALRQVRRQLRKTA